MKIWRAAEECGLSLPQTRRVKYARSINFGRVHGYFDGSRREGTRSVRCPLGFSVAWDMFDSFLAPWTIPVLLDVQHTRRMRRADPFGASGKGTHVHRHGLRPGRHLCGVSSGR